MLDDIIKISGGFQSSVNIAYDLYNYEKIKRFIPTASALELISNVMLSTSDDSTQRAKILTGAYGRGKSHIVLVLLYLLNNMNSRNLNNLINNFKKYDNESYKLISNYICSGKRLLPVLISGSSINLTQSFMNALQQALNNNGLDDIMPNTHFRAAEETINKWKISYPDTYEQFTKKISVKIRTFNNMLNAHDTETYKEFLRIYPELTAGSVFNPFVDFDVADLYENVSCAISEKGYNGLYIVYDEFGKYLETSIATATESDTKMLQDLAEKCCRSGKNQMHLMLICHKDISNYIDMNLSQDKVDGWRGISGRFEHINLHNNYSQMYEIIAAVIGKNKSLWSLFCKDHKSAFDNLAKRYSENLLISGNKSEAKKIILSCYPLHPSTMYILPRLSERVAQNERTLFTFLSSNQKNTLIEFLEKCDNEFPFVTPEYLYDYFEPQLRKELNSSEIYKTYSLTSKILRKVKKNSLQSKIVKTIALIYIIEQFDKFPPTVDVITETFIDIVNDPKEITDAINDLINNACIVYLKRSNYYLKLKETNGVNVKDQIDNRVDKLKIQFDTKDILNELTFDNYLYPVQYNDAHCITRYFNFKFITSAELNGKFDYVVQFGSSGIVNAVFFETEEEFNNFKFIIPNDQRIIIVVPRQFTDISVYVFEYKAILELKSENADDEILSDEYDVYLEDIEGIINNFIRGFLRPETQKADYFHCGEKLELFRKSHLSSLLTEICERIYTLTPIINNESINKNVLPTIAINSRTKLITAILENDIIRKNLGLSGSGQDVSFMRSTLIQTGILTEIDGAYAFNLAPADNNMRNVLDIIAKFFRDAATRENTSFEILYNILTESDHRIGLKRGVIPIYIAVVLRAVMNDIVILYKNEEVKISADLLNSINEYPSNYSVIMENWNEEKRNYLKVLENIFKEYIVEREKNFNSFSYIVSAMNRWYISLPRCSKEMTVRYDNDKAIPKEHIRFINSLRSLNNNSREFLMIDIPKIFGQRKETNEIIKCVKSAKNNFDNGKSYLQKSIVSIIKTTFDGKKRAELISVIRDWLETLTPRTFNHQFENSENIMLSLLINASNDELMFIDGFSKVVVGLRIDDWNKSTLDSFKKGLKEFKKTVEDYNGDFNLQAKDNSNNCRIVFLNESGNEVIREFEPLQYSAIAKLLYNDITAAIDEIGQSISENEKRQVLIEILKKMCQ